MAAHTYAQAMKLLRKDEGGYVNHPKDPGGATNHGVTQAVYDSWRKKRGEYIRSVRQIEEFEVNAIYRTLYADKVRYDDLPAGVDYATLDAAVNSGVSRGARWLQQALKISVDGQVGPLTIAKAKSSDPMLVIKAICATRLAFVQSLKTWSTFGKGWGRRIAGVEANAVKMHLESRSRSPEGIKSYLEAEASVANENSASQSKVAQGTALAPTAAVPSTAAFTDINVIALVALGAVAVGMLGLAFYFYRQSKINAARADAYKTAAQEKPNV